jgi:hypothetical protein
MTFHRTKTCEVAEVFVDNFDRQQELGAVVAIHHRGVLVFAEVTHGTTKII